MNLQRSIYAGMLAGALMLSAQPAQKQQPQPFGIREIKPGFYIVTGGGPYVGVRVAGDGVILVDTKQASKQNYTDLMEQIRTVTSQPVKYVIVSHHHGGGNIASFLEAGVKVVAHEDLAKNLTATDANPHPGLPNVTYAKDYTIHQGGVEVQLHHYGRGHTFADTIVYYPDLRVVQGSDVVAAGGAPNIDYASGGSAVEWVRVLDSILKLDFDSVVAGSGNVYTKAELAAFKGKIETLLSRAQELIRKGVPKDQLMAQIRMDDLGWKLTLTPERLDKFYAEVSAMK